jgi:hypothetical protein
VSSKNLRAGGDGNLRPFPDNAQLRAETRITDGDVVQFWEAPNNTGGLCTYIRVLPRQGREGKQGGGVGCGMPDGTPDDEKTAWDRVARFSWEPVFSDRAAVYGHIESRLKAVTARVTLTDGRRLAIPVNQAGYFLGILPPFVEIQQIPADVRSQGHAATVAWLRTHPGVRIRAVAALDGNGRVLVTHNEIIANP